MMTELIGSIAAVMTTLAFLPQVLHILKSRDTRGISGTMYSIFTSGVFLWLIYGCLIGSWPVIIANALTFVLAAIILLLKLRHG
ncbi:MAG: SemiSWEET transporter [Hahellaceae bacterium]|nr:SemiSWEET transporter [Hahellaceae bacterium]